MDVERTHSPFDHVLIAAVLPDRVAEQSLVILEEAFWELREGPGFRYETTISKAIGRLLAAPIEDAKRALEAALELKLEYVALGLHRYDRLAGIAPHTDRGVAEYRLVLSLNRGWEIPRGGIWLLSAQADLAGARRYVPPLHNTAFGFLAAPDSFHAMTDVIQGSNYAIVMAFEPLRA